MLPVPDMCDHVKGPLEFLRHPCQCPPMPMSPRRPSRKSWNDDARGRHHSVHLHTACSPAIKESASKARAMAISLGPRRDQGLLREHRMYPARRKALDNDVCNSMPNFGMYTTATPRCARKKGEGVQENSTELHLHPQGESLSEIKHLCEMEQEEVDGHECQHRQSRGGQTQLTTHQPRSKFSSKRQICALFTMFA